MRGGDTSTDRTGRQDVKKIGTINIYYMICHFIHKLQAILSTMSGWLSFVGVLIANFFAGYEFTIKMVAIVVVLDLLWAVASAIKRGTFAYSYLGKETVSKLSVYGSVIAVFIAIEKLTGVNITITTILICSVIMLVEVWSMAGSMLIVFPHMPFLRLLRPILAGEIAHKLRISEDEVENFLNGDNKKNK